MSRHTLCPRASCLLSTLHFPSLQPYAPIIIIQKNPFTGLYSHSGSLTLCLIPHYDTAGDFKECFAKSVSYNCRNRNWLHIKTGLYEACVLYWCATEYLEGGQDEKTLERYNIMHYKCMYQINGVYLRSVISVSRCGRVGAEHCPVPRAH